MNTDWQVYDWKKLSGNYLKRTNFRIQASKMWTFEKNKATVAVRDIYSAMPIKKDLRKLRTTKFKCLKPCLLPNISHLNQDKANDVANLLSFVNLTDAEEDYYATILQKIAKKKTIKPIEYPVAL